MIKASGWEELSDAERAAIRRQMEENWAAIVEAAEELERERGSMDWYLSQLGDA